MLSNLKELRKEFGLSQKQMAEKLSISQQTYSDYETCKTEPTTDMLIKMSKIFNVSLDYMVGIVDEFGVPIITPEERAAGMSETRKEYITPIEDDLLYVFRNIGKKFGKQAQRDYITVGENMLKLK